MARSLAVTGPGSGESAVFQTITLRTDNIEIRWSRLSRGGSVLSPQKERLETPQGRGGPKRGLSIEAEL